MNLHPELTSQQESPAANPPAVLPALRCLQQDAASPWLTPVLHPTLPFIARTQASDENICGTDLNQSNPLILQVRPTGG